jgi:hypothetical protein
VSFFGDGCRTISDSGVMAAQTGKRSRSPIIRLLPHRALLAGIRRQPHRLDEYVFSDELTRLARKKVANGEWKEDWATYIL